jgi:hypothetical protein
VILPPLGKIENCRWTVLDSLTSLPTYRSFLFRAAKKFLLPWSKLDVGKF